MAGYTFYFTRRDRLIPDFDFAEFTSHDEALASAIQQLKLHSSAEAVEVVHNEKVIGKIAREDLQRGFP